MPGHTIVLLLFPSFMSLFPTLPIAPTLRARREANMFSRRQDELRNSNQIRCSVRRCQKRGGKAGPTCIYNLWCTDVMDEFIDSVSELRKDFGFGTRNRDTLSLPQHVNQSIEHVETRTEPGRFLILNSACLFKKPIPHARLASRHCYSPSTRRLPFFPFLWHVDLGSIWLTTWSSTSCLGCHITRVRSLTSWHFSSRTLS